MATTTFASVKLPGALVEQARQAAQPMRRSVASQIEYWATLGQIVEHTGLSVQEARSAIEQYEAAASRTATAAAPPLGRCPHCPPAGRTNARHPGAAGA